MSVHWFNKPASLPACLPSIPPSNLFICLPGSVFITCVPCFINKPNKNAEPGVRRANVIQHSYRKGHFNSSVVWKRLRGWRQEDPLKNSASMPDEGWVHGFINQCISKRIQIFTVCYLFFLKPLLQRDLSHIVWTDYFNVYWLPYLCCKPWGFKRSAPLMSSMKSVSHTFPLFPASICFSLLTPGQPTMNRLKLALEMKSVCFPLYNLINKISFVSLMIVVMKK